MPSDPLLLQNLSCPCCGHIVGQGSYLNSVKLGLNPKFDWIGIKNARIGKNGDILSGVFSGNKCDKCTANQRKRD